jgi:uncharacterized OB-fold protein
MAADGLRAFPEPPEPTPDDWTAPFWAASAEARLVMQYCTSCQRYRHFPEPLCPSCHTAEHLTWQPVSGVGTIYSYVIVNETRAAAFASSTPYVVICVELQEQVGLRMFTNLIGEGRLEVYVGAPVIVDFSDVRGRFTIPQFRLASF